MNDRENAIIRTIETKVALAENREQKEIWVTIDVMREILALLKEQEHGETFTVIDTKTEEEAEERG